MKTCIICKKIYSFSKFSARKSSKDGFRNNCKSCQSERDKSNYYKNRDARRAQQKEYYIENFESISKNKEEYRKENLDKIGARNVKRYCSKLQRTPKWLTQEDYKIMESFYVEAARLTKETGIPHEVDHIIPLQGKTVSGLHVPSNLQILTASQNQSKGNRVF